MKISFFSLLFSGLLLGVLSSEMTFAAPKKAEPKQERAEETLQEDVSKTEPSIAKDSTVGKATLLGIELGGVPTFLFSDSNIQAFGLGVGSNMGIYGVFRNDKTLAIKARVEHVYLREEAMSKAPMDFYIPGTYLKALTQEYMMFAGGVEFRQPGVGNQFFYEATLGYAVGVSGSAEVTPKTGTAVVEGRNVPLVSTFFLGGGAGLRRKFTEKLSGVASGRTFFLLGTPYKGDLKNKMFIPMPIMLSVGLEYFL